MSNGRQTQDGSRVARACRRGATWRALPWLAAACLLAGCGEPPSAPEVRIRAALAEAEAAAQDNDFDALAASVARDYADRAGRDRRTLLLMLRALLMRYPRLELIVTLREIEILSPQLARVRLELLAAGVGPAGMSADAVPVELSLRDEGDGWKVTRAEWGRRIGDGI